VSIATSPQPGLRQSYAAAQPNNTGISSYQSPTRLLRITRCAWATRGLTMTPCGELHMVPLVPTQSDLWDNVVLVPLACEHEVDPQRRRSVGSCPSAVEGKRQGVVTLTQLRNIEIDHLIE
jgi:hypothetical protein